MQLNSTQQLVLDEIIKELVTEIKDEGYDLPIDILDKATQFFRRQVYAKVYEA